jgi:E3 ubiquitin-protein ligase CHFR
MGTVMSSQPNPDIDIYHSHLSATTSTTAINPLKRRAVSATAEDADEVLSKKTKVVHVPITEPHELEATSTIDGAALATDLAQELECGCCSAVVYKPVVVMPCQHFFCGR